MPALRIPRAFKRRLNRKSAALQGSILECVKRLGVDPRHPGLRTHRVNGTVGVWEAYVDGANRVTFHWEGDTIVLRNNCRHEIITQNP